MADTVYKKLEMVGTSSKSLSDAIAVAVAKARQAEPSLRWFEVIEQRGAIIDGQIQYQVTLSLGVKMD